MNKKKFIDIHTGETTHRYNPDDGVTTRLGTPVEPYLIPDSWNPNRLIDPHTGEKKYEVDPVRHTIFSWEKLEEVSEIQVDYD